MFLLEHTRMQLSGCSGHFLLAFASLSSMPTLQDTAYLYQTSETQFWRVGYCLRHSTSTTEQFQHGHLGSEIASKGSLVSVTNNCVKCFATLWEPLLWQDLAPLRDASHNLDLVSLCLFFSPCLSAISQALVRGQNYVRRLFLPPSAFLHFHTALSSFMSP